MKCPHCTSASTFVSETRRWKGDVWRRHKCEACDGTFVSQQLTSVDMQMPRGVFAGRKRSKKDAPPTHDSGAALQHFWAVKPEGV